MALVQHLRLAQNLPHVAQPPRPVRQQISRLELARHAVAVNLRADVRHPLDERLQRGLDVRTAAVRPDGHLDAVPDQLVAKAGRVRRITAQAAAAVAGDRLQQLLHLVDAGLVDEELGRQRVDAQAAQVEVLDDPSGKMGEGSG